MKESKTRGGARPGAGRPTLASQGKTARTEIVSTRVEPEMAKWLDEAAGMHYHILRQAYDRREETSMKTELTTSQLKSAALCYGELMRATGAWWGVQRKLGGHVQELGLTDRFCRMAARIGVALGYLEAAPGTFGEDPADVVKLRERWNRFEALCEDRDGIPAADLTNDAFDAIAGMFGVAQEIADRMIVACFK